jgi:hypothetical protein
MEANGIWTGLVVDSSHVDLNNSNFQNTFDSTSVNPQCTTVQLYASTIGHITSNRGVEILDTSPLADIHKTLVGMCYVGSGQTVLDTPTNRDCASWYNRGLKTCLNTFTSDQSTNSLTYMELNSGIECNFVTWGTGDPTGQNDLSWSISGMMSSDTGMDGAAVTAGFGPSAMLTPETEQTALLNPSTPVGGFPFSVKGSKSGLAEGFHIITLLGKAITGGNATVSGTTLQTSLEVRIPQ